MSTAGLTTRSKIDGRSASVIPCTGTTIRQKGGRVAHVRRATIAITPRRQGHARLTHAMGTTAVVHGAITIVVDTVGAYFRHGEYGLRAGERACGAIERSVYTRSLLHGHHAIAAAAGISFVGVAIAIVVEIIANLGGRHDRLRTERRSVLA
jgi:hypothetical protein